MLNKVLKICEYSDSDQSVTHRFTFHQLFHFMAEGVYREIQ